jgi:hypothetical protein
MATSKPFAWSSGGSPAGTGIVGETVYGINPNINYANNYGGLTWWQGPDEDLGYVIAYGDFSNSQPTPTSGTSKVQFWRSKVKTMNSFVSMSNFISRRYNFTSIGQPLVFYSGEQAKSGLEQNGFYTTYTETIPSGCSANTVINLSFPNLDVSECQTLSSAPNAFFCSETSGMDIGDTWYLDLSMTTPYLEGIVLEQKFGPTVKTKFTINSSGTITNKEICP